MRAALRSMAHRGPDDEGLYRSGRAVLGHRRLSIIDTSAAGHQPFTDGGGRYTIVFNGEVFNFLELRAQLETQGHSFRSRTDTEVVLKQFIVKGEAFLNDLNGFFALAIHDALEDTLFLARDRFGIKPLLWCQQEDSFLFASELRALIDLGIPREQDPVSLRQFFTHQFIPNPWTVFRAVRKLEPGHWMKVTPQEVRTGAWYSLAAAVRSKRGAPPVDELFDLVEKAVQDRLVADVPVGTFLSGGLDSSIISALAARHHPDLHTFSIGYADDPYFDESAHAEAVAGHIGSTHHAFRLTREELAEAYPRFLNAVDEPFADSSALPSFILCERTRGFVAVALSGDGADEVFGGYRKHQAELRWRQPGLPERMVKLLAPLWRTLPHSRNSSWQDKFRQFDRFARLAAKTPEERHALLATFTPDALVNALCTPPMVHGELVSRESSLLSPLREDTSMNGVLLAEMRSTLPDNMLHKVDITSMAHGLEVRPPFLDHRVVEYAFALPPERKLLKGNGKVILKRTFGHLLPPAIPKRPKKGFEVPLLHLFQGPLNGFVRDQLARDRVEAAGLCPKTVTGLIDRLRSKDAGQAQATLHAALVYVVWWERHASATAL